MKNPQKETVSCLEDLPNVGSAIAARLRAVGIDHPQKLAGKNPLALYRQLCAVTAKRHDPCVLDTFMAVVHFVERGEALPWWAFTAERKRTLPRQLSPDRDHRAGSETTTVSADAKRSSKKR